MSVPEPVMTEYDLAVDRDFRRNAACFVGWEFLWGLGMPFAMFATFAPAYLGALQAPKALIGLVLSVPFLSAPCQMMASYLLPRRWRLRTYRAAIVACLVPWVVYSIVAAVWGEGWPLWLHWALFSLAMAIYVGVANVGSPIYWEMMTDNIPPRRRGRLFGLRAAGQGVAGLLTGVLASLVLAHWSTPQNFRVSFIVGVSIFLVSCGSMWFVRDHINPVHAAAEADVRLPFLAYLRSTIHQVWGDPNYRIFLFFQAMIAMALAAAPLMVAAARDQLGAEAQGQGGFSLVYLGTVAGVGWLIGLLADRYGYRFIGCVAGALLAAMFLICLLTHRMVFWYVAYGAYATMTFMYPMLLCNMSAELCPEIPPNRLMAVSNTLMLGFVVTSTVLSGAIVDFTHSYTPIFIANFVLSVVAVLGFAVIVREPRSGRLLMLKMTPRS
jgi:MFS family permease